MFGNSVASFCSLDWLKSVAYTAAPSFAKARAVAAPMPCPAAVSNAFFPCNLPLTHNLQFAAGEFAPLWFLIHQCPYWNVILKQYAYLPGCAAGRRTCNPSGCDSNVIGWGDPSSSTAEIF